MLTNTKIPPRKLVEYFIAKDRIKPLQILIDNNIKLPTKYIRHPTDNKEVIKFLKENGVNIIQPKKVSPFGDDDNDIVYPGFMAWNGISSN